MRRDSNSFITDTHNQESLIFRKMKFRGKFTPLSRSGDDFNSTSCGRIFHGIADQIFHYFSKRPASARISGASGSTLVVKTCFSLNGKIKRCKKERKSSFS